MKRLGQWAAACILFVGLQLFFTYKLLIPDIDRYGYRVTWSEGIGSPLDTGMQWRALTPHYAWPILATYGGALLIVGITVAVAIGRSIILRERQAIAQREAAVGLQEEQVRIATAETKRIRTAAQNQVHAAREEMKRCRQEAAVQIDEANTRLQGSVDTNMGRQKQIQKLKARVTELEQQVTMGHC